MASEVSVRLSAAGAGGQVPAEPRIEVRRRFAVADAGFGRYNSRHLRSACGTILRNNEEIGMNLYQRPRGFYAALAALLLLPAVGAWAQAGGAAAAAAPTKIGILNVKLAIGSTAEGK